MAAWNRPKYAAFVALPPAGKCRILQNSVNTQKFCRNGQILWLGSKFHVPWKTVVPTHKGRWQGQRIYRRLEIEGRKIWHFRQNVLGTQWGMFCQKINFRPSLICTTD